MQPRVIVVEDEDGVRSGLVEALAAQGYEVAGFPSADAFMRAAPAGAADLILLDIMMPGTDGVRFCSEWRARGNAQPIIFLSGKSSDFDKVLALESGGDDFMTKPFSMIELLCRVRVCLRRALGRPEPSPPGSGFFLDDDGCRCWIGGKELGLTVSEYRILAGASRGPRKVYTREDLMRLAYPEDPYLSERNADAHVKRIRRKLKDAGAPEGAIRTVYGLGYRFELP
jgi:DNA-binding response OmpR family regulator